MRTRSVQIKRMCFLKAVALFVYTISSAETTAQSSTWIIPAEQLRNPKRLTITQSEEISRALSQSPQSKVSSLAIGRDGTAYLLDVGLLRVVVIGPNGRQTRIMNLLTGQSDTFEPSAIAFVHDTVLVLGRGRSKLSPRRVFQMRVFASGRYEVLDSPIEFPAGFGLFKGTDSGWFFRTAVRSGAHLLQPRSGPAADSIILASFEPRTVTSRQILAAPNAPRFSLGSAPCPPIQCPILFTRFMGFEPSFGVAADGTIYGNDVGGYEITVRANTGVLGWTISGRVDRIPVSRQEFLKHLDSEIKQAESPPDGDNPRMERARALRTHGNWVGAAQFKPVLGALWASRTGHVLVRRLDVEATKDSRGVSVWDVLSTKERVYVGQLEIATAQPIEAFEWPFVYTVSRDTPSSVYRYKIATG